MCYISPMGLLEGECEQFSRMPSRRFMSNGGKADMNSEECMKMFKELDLKAKRLTRHVKVMDRIVLLGFGLTAGSLIVLSAQSTRNKDENSLRVAQLKRTEDGLKTGIDLLEQVKKSVAEGLACRGDEVSPASTTDGQSSAGLLQDPPASQ